MNERNCAILTLHIQHDLLTKRNNIHNVNTVLKKRQNKVREWQEETDFSRDINDSALIPLLDKYETCEVSF